ncbi:hypothetical protein [Inhella sp.]|uniref:hypothetical protein n=1 Tax=Inhella sp. TaxID=1921806 RepID=UPI0035B2C9EC
MLGALSALVPAAQATPSLQATLRVGAETRLLFGMTEAMESFPGSAALNAARREGLRCSAWGAPVQKLALQGQQLLLVGFSRCGPDDLGLSEAYGPPGTPLHATWITGALWFPKGRQLCGNPYANQIWEWHVHLDVKAGRVERMRTLDMRHDPLIPTVGDRHWCRKPAPPPALPAVPIQVTPGEVPLRKATPRGS